MLSEVKNIVPIKGRVNRGLFLSFVDVKNLWMNCVMEQEGFSNGNDSTDRTLR